MQIQVDLTLEQQKITGQQEHFSDYEDNVNYDFSKHPKAITFKAFHLSYIVSLDEPFHINSTASAQKLAQIVTNQLRSPSLKIERNFVLQLLLQTTNELIIKKFLDSGGLLVIFDWLQHYVKGRIETGQRMTLLEEEIVNKILAVLGKSPLTVDMLKAVKVGKLVNQIRLHSNSQRELK